ncbi:MAG: histidine kinase [Flavobacterium sp.]|nr:histidine kinase [Pedobacter sp.]
MSIKSISIPGHFKSPFIICILLFISIGQVLSQNINLKNYTVHNGLANSMVYYTLQDSKGFLWVATSSGVNRFDGNNFETFTTDDGLADNEVLSIYEDSKGRIWFCNLNGRLGYYTEGKFYNPENTVTLNKAVTKASIIGCFEDSLNRLWFSTNQQQIIEIENNNVTIHTKPDKILDISNTYIFEDHKNQVIAANIKGFYLLNNPKIKVINSRFLPSSNKSFQYNKITKKLIFTSNEGLIAFHNGIFRIIRYFPEGFSVADLGVFLTDEVDLWISSRNRGLYFFSKDARNTRQYLPRKIISHIMLDSEKNIWVSTMGDGLILLPSQTDKVLQYTTESGLQDNSVYSIFKEKSGKIWLGLKSGYVSFLDGKKISSINLNQSQNPYNPIKKLEYDAERNSIWFASSSTLGEISIKNPKGKVRYLKEKNNLAFSVKSFSISKKGKFAFSLASGVYILKSKNKPLVFRTAFNLPNQKFFPDRSFKIYYDSKERLWFSNVNGLFRFANNRVDTLSKITDILSNRITDILELPDGNMAIGTYGYGMIILKPDNTFSHINLENGLTSNICRKLAFDGKYLWLTTFSGVDRFEYNSKNKKIDTYKIKDGLTSDEVLDIYIDRDKIFLGTNEGLTVLPRNTPTVKLKPPLFYITSLSINGRLQKLKNTPDLLYNENNISVKYTAINYSHSEVFYQYRLKINTPWISTKSNTIEFGSLEPGDYNLSIRARLQNTKWSKIALFSFNIQPAYWQKWWFTASLYALISFVLILLIYRFFRKQRQKEKDKLTVQAKIMALEQRALQAMMNPHFIFNIMNSIQYFINTQDSGSANEVLTGFARLVRKNLEICSKTYITLEEELIYLKLYLSLEKLRFGEKMTYNITISESIDTEETMIPSMLIQPFVENAIWHGIMPKQDGGKILIDIQSDKTELSIQIIDDGMGIKNSIKNKKSNHTSRGMQITNDRINLLNTIKKGSLISITSEQTGEAGTCVLVTIPL